MPIVRTYQCEDCFHRIEVTLTMEQCDDPPPPCPVCERMEMQQEFRPVAIGGSTRARAVKLTEDIISNDYGVADFQAEGKQGHAVKHRLKDQGTPAQAATWGATSEAMSLAIAEGRRTRMEGGSGLDILQNALKTGEQPDLIELSKRRSMKVW